HEYRAGVSSQVDGKHARMGYCSSSVASVSSGGGDPPCTSPGVVSCGAIGVRAAPRFRGGLRLAVLAGVGDGSRFVTARRLALVPRLVAVRRLAVVRRFAVVR